MIRERAYNGIPGLPMLFALLAVDAGLIWMLVMNIREENAPEIVFAAVMIALTTFLMAGLFLVNPNEGKVLQLFGEYKGTAKAGRGESDDGMVVDLDVIKEVVQPAVISRVDHFNLNEIIAEFRQRTTGNPIKWISPARSASNRGAKRRIPVTRPPCDD